MLSFSSIMIGSARPKKLAEFYEKVVGKKPDWSDGGWFGFRVSGTHFTIGPHSKVKGKAKEPERIILNFETTKVEKEFERIKALGTKVVKEPYALNEAGEPVENEDGMLIATFADPDGNFFQLMSPWENEMN